MSNDSPRFMMVVNDNLHAYWTKDILYIDVLLFYKEHNYYPEIYEIKSDTLKLTYAKISKDQLKSAV